MRIMVQVRLCPQCDGGEDIHRGDTVHTGDYGPRPTATAIPLCQPVLVDDDGDVLVPRNSLTVILSLKIFLTVEDRYTKVLGNCEHNIALNAHLLNRTVVRHMDWTKLSPQALNTEPISPENLNTSTTKYSWDSSDVELLPEVSVILAADVLYGIKSAQDLLDRLEVMLGSHKHSALYITLEKRTNFYLETLSCESPVYDLFYRVVTHGGSRLCGEKIDMDTIPHHVSTPPYNRTSEMEMWVVRHN
ncbi:methyltransferase-like protein 22 [Pelomyxa schiedti]|nr:methyltransferase-like protein 22 [Pelomyxa schiedti]